MTFVVDGAPVGKGRPRMTKTGIVYTPRKTVMYERAVRAAFLEAGGQPLPEGLPVKVKITAYYPIPASDSKTKHEKKASGQLRPLKKPDCDNVIKVILDALNGCAYKDDTQVVDVRLVKLYSDYPRVEVEISEDKSYA